MTESMNTVSLLHDTVQLNDITFNQAIDIAKSFPQARNEARIGALIGHVTGDSQLARRLTASERYYFLLRHQDATQNGYTEKRFNIDDYVMPNTVQSDVPDSVPINDDLHIGHLYGAHVQVLEQKCENAADWMNGQIICQMYGNISSLLGGDEEVYWEKIPASASDAEINEAIEERLPFLSERSANSEYNDLAQVFSEKVLQLDHFVNLTVHTDGLVVDCVEEGKGIPPRRFLCLSAIGGVAGDLISSFG